MNRSRTLAVVDNLEDTEKILKVFNVINATVTYF